ncbi:hypothetical protein COO60DRAFT_1474256, partial [Scenedesmus sp. NREL 46B-D3]
MGCRRGKCTLFSASHWLPRVCSLLSLLLLLLLVLLLAGVAMLSGQQHLSTPTCATAVSDQQQLVRLWGGHLLCLAKQLKSPRRMQWAVLLASERLSCCSRGW